MRRGFHFWWAQGAEESQECKPGEVKSSSEGPLCLSLPKGHVCTRPIDDGTFMQNVITIYPGYKFSNEFIPSSIGISQNGSRLSLAGSLIGDSA